MRLPRLFQRLDTSWANNKGDFFGLVVMIILGPTVYFGITSQIQFFGWKPIDIIILCIQIFWAYLLVKFVIYLVSPAKIPKNQGAIPEHKTNRR